MLSPNEDFYSKSFTGLIPRAFPLYLLDAFVLLLRSGMAVFPTQLLHEAVYGLLQEENCL